MSDYTIVKTHINPEVTASPALPEDTPSVMRLLVRTAEWLKSKGSSQWSGLLEGEDSHNTAEAIRRNEVFVFKRGALLVGILMLLRKPSAWDKELWSEDGHESSVYLHRLAIQREESGKGLGKEMMQWALSGIRFSGKDRIRLDCITGNPTLNAFYSGLGFEYKGMSSNAIGDFSKYEKRTSEVFTNGMEALT